MNNAAQVLLVPRVTDNRRIINGQASCVLSSKAQLIQKNNAAQGLLVPRVTDSSTPFTLGKINDETAPYKCDETASVINDETAPICRATPTSFVGIALTDLKMGNAGWVLFSSDVGQIFHGQNVELRQIVKLRQGEA